MRKAFFVSFPRRVSDLRRPHRVEEERPYRVTRIVLLPDIDYENFAEDLLADRAFLRPAQGCLLIKSKHRRDGILVYARGDRVQRAAYFSGEG